MRRGLALLALTALAAGAALCAAAVETERQLLSGTGAADAVRWDFYCPRGRGCGAWTTIPVPLSWELAGFLTYNYGHDKRKAADEGLYRRRFTVPAAWRDRRVEVVFEGVMTDAEVRVNGASAGPRHHGGFYRFRYDVTPLLRFGEENEIEVAVWERSEEASVNAAERDADYWLFGGIYRPVYLEATPREGIAGLAVDAGHDGRFAVRVALQGRGDGALRLEARIATLAGAPVAVAAAEVAAGEGEGWIRARVHGVEPWSAESPHLYQLEVTALRNGRELHRVRQRFGFRTVAVQPGEGLFVNDRRVRLKGVNRHAFWPTTGRTVDPALDRRDAERIKAMNLNAVRTSHYPPNPAFLEACDELGIYVVDELAGWHDAYATDVGQRLVREMVTRDVNHPSILFWANGNEGGWNDDLDPLFAELDPQRRPVLHPDADFGGFDTKHYLGWDDLTRRLGPPPWQRGEKPSYSTSLVMPTELLHGLYDGGGGAGLSDYWARLRASPRGAGFFLWSFSDEAVVRTDRGGVLDADGNHAPDGLLGPYREDGASFDAVREILSPIWMVGAWVGDSVTLLLENRFVETNLAQCRFSWRLLDLPGPGETWRPGSGAGGTVPGPWLAPGRLGSLRLPVPPGSGDAVRIAARDPAGRVVNELVLPVRDLRADVRERMASSSTVATAREEGGRWILTSPTTVAEIDRRSGELVRLARDGRTLPLARGPRLILGPTPRPLRVELVTAGGAQLVEAYYEVAAGEGGLQSVRWTLDSSGWLRLDFAYDLADPAQLHGVTFDYPRADLRTFRWVGNGPARVWRNRTAGPRLGAWQKDAAAETPIESAAEPKIAGFYSDVVWAALASDAGEVILAPDDAELALGLFAPQFPADAGTAVAVAPPDDTVGFYRGIPAIGTKFHPPDELGPSSVYLDPNVVYRGTVWIHAGPPPGTAAAKVR